MHDDGEIGASLKLQDFLVDHKSKERGVLLVRYFGGQLLGLRFTLMEKVVKEAMDLLDTKLSAK